MKKLLTGSVLSAFVFVMMATVVSAAAPENFGGNGSAWDHDMLDRYEGHYTNLNNPGNRKDWDHHRFAMPGQGGMHANENAAVQAHGNGSLVVPPAGM